MRQRTAAHSVSEPLGQFFLLTHPECQNFQESHCLLVLLVAFDVLYDHLGFAILGNDHGLLLFGKGPYDFGGVGLQIADGPNLA